MHTFTKAGGAAVAVVALALTLSGCGSDSKTEATSSSPSSTSESSETSTAAPTSAAPATANETIADYIKKNGITETPVKRGDPGSPTLELPTPAGWEDAGPRTPPDAWCASSSPTRRWPPTRRRLSR